MTRVRLSRAINTQSLPGPCKQDRLGRLKLRVSRHERLMTQSSERCSTLQWLYALILLSRRVRLWTPSHCSRRLRLLHSASALSHLPVSCVLILIIIPRRLAPPSKDSRPSHSMADTPALRDILVALTALLLQHTKPHQHSNPRRRSKTRSKGEKSLPQIQSPSPSPESAAPHRRPCSCQIRPLAGPSRLCP